MKNERLNDEISAYLDGEASDPARVQRLIQQSEDVASAYMAYAKLSSHLKALPEPDVHPAFATRVLARVREEQEAAQARPHWARWFAGATAVAALALAAAVPLMANFRTTTPKEATLAAVNEHLIVDELERRVADGDKADAIQSESYTFGDLMASYSMPPANDRDMLMAVAESEWFDHLAVEVSAKQGLPEALSQLDPVETKVFLQLLEDYAEDGTAL